METRLYANETVVSRLAAQNNQSDSIKSTV